MQIWLFVGRCCNSVGLLSMVCLIVAWKMLICVFIYRYVSVDIFGGCGKHSCVKENNGCRKVLSDDYKFYLAFENSNCLGYITEKPGFQALLWVLWYL